MGNKRKKTSRIKNIEIKTNLIKCTGSQNIDIINMKAFDLAVLLTGQGLFVSGNREPGVSLKNR